MNITGIISLVALFCSIIIASNNFFGLRDRILQLFSGNKIIGDYCKLIAEATGIVNLPVATPKGLQKSMVLSDIFMELPIDVVQENLSNNSTSEIKGNKEFQHTDYATKYIHESDLGGEMGGQFKPFQKAFEWQQLVPGKRLIILGERGCGKSTLLKWLAYNYSSKSAFKSTSTNNFPKNLPDQDWIPIYIPGKDLNLLKGTASSLQENISHQIRSLQKPFSWVKKVEQGIHKLLGEGRIILLIDGIDEISDHQVRSRFCSDLNRFSKIYPQVPILATTLNTIFGSISKQFGEHFEIAQISALKQEDKTEFAKKWAKLVSDGKENPVFTENLQNEITGSQNLSRLTDNIQLLTLILQLFQSTGTLPDHRTKIFRKSITSFLEKQSVSSDKLSVNEVFLQLEFLAYSMREKDENFVSRLEIIDRLQEFRKNRPFSLTEDWKSPQEFLQLIENNTGLLFSSGKEVDHHGIELEYFQFFHQSFQDFFAAQAVIHGNSTNGSPEANLQENVLKFVSNLEIENREIPNLSNTSLQEPVFAERWQEVARGMIDGLPRELIEEVLLHVLYPSHQPQLGESRARAVFATFMLAQEQNVSQEVADKIISTLVENIRPDIDSKGAGRNTMLDEAFTELAKSSWRLLSKKYLLQHYFKVRGLGRSAIGTILSSKYIETELDFKDLELDFFPDAFSTEKTFESKENLLYEILRLMTYAFIHQDELKQDKTQLIHPIINELLGKHYDSEPIRTAVLWALGWITQARLRDRNESIKIDDKQIKCLTKLISQPNYDSMAIYWACLCLSCIEEVKGNDKIDWVYEWAVVADRKKDWSDLPSPQPPVDRPDIIQPLLKVLSPTYHPTARRGAAIALGRLNIFTESALDDLLSIIVDKSVYHTLENEALSYLVHNKSQIVGEQLYRVYSEEGKKDEDIQAHAFLALLGLGDLPLLEKLFINGENTLGLPGDRTAIIHVLKTHPEKQGRKIIDRLLQEADRETRIVIKTGLSEYDSVAGKAKIVLDSLESENDDIHETPEELQEKTVFILLVTGENTEGNPIFAYVAVRADRLPEFMEAQNSDLFYPEDYGVIIESGEGKPSKEIRKMMEEDYGFDHNNQLYLN